MSQSMKEIVDVTNAFWASSLDAENYINPTEDTGLGYEFSRYIYHHAGGVYSFEAVEKAFEALKTAGKLKRKYKPKSPEQIASERAAAKEAADIATVNEWLARHCPTGLKTKSGKLNADDAERIFQFVERNYNNQVSLAALNDSIQNLAPVLTWFERSPESMEIRGLPKPQPKQLTEKQLIESGQKTDPSTRRSHADDGKIKTVAEVAEETRKAFLKARGLEDPEDLAWRQKREALIVQGRMGRTRFDLTAEMRKIIIYKKDGKTVDEKATFLAQDKFCTEAEKQAKR